jgi:hypothetical protein
MDSSKMRKRSQSPSCDSDRPNKKPCTSEQGSRQMQNRTYPFRFHHTDEDWLRTACRRLGVEFVRCDLDGGGPNVPLMHPRRVRHIVGDGNCLFHSFFVSHNWNWTTARASACSNSQPHTPISIKG